MLALYKYKCHHNILNISSQHSYNFIKTIDKLQWFYYLVVSFNIWMGMDDSTNIGNECLI